MADLIELERDDDSMSVPQIIEGLYTLQKAAFLDESFGIACLLQDARIELINYQVMIAKLRSELAHYKSFCGSIQ